jgi:hypothetical protein
MKLSVSEAAPSAENRTPMKSTGMKGTGFSPYIETPKKYRALAPEVRIFTSIRPLGFLFAIILAPLLITPSQAQTTTQPDQPNPPAGKVIFSRSTDENGLTTQTGPTTTPPPVKMADAPTAEDADRQAVTFTAFDIDVHLRPAEHHIAVRALLTVRNGGAKPLAHIPLQISSSLNWERIRLLARDVTFQVATLNSDEDHTGQLHEAAVPLPQPLQPGGSIQLDVTYSGLIPANAQRLLTIGTPDDVALHSDWDQISADFTGLRGFGNVVWYPVSSVPVILGDGARLFDEIGAHKLRLSGAHFRLRLAVEFPPGLAPTVALINGHPAPLTVTDPGDLSQEVSGVATADAPDETLGFETPNLFVAIRTPHAATNTALWALPEDESAVKAWSDAAATVSPFLEGWLGKRPRSQLTLLDLPDPQDLPFETGSMLATGIHPESAEQLNGIMAHALTHSWVESPRAWLSEGVAHFIGTLWIEKQTSRTQALESLEASRPALALAEPESPGQSPGQPLAQAISPVYYRTKAAYVFWMLRSVAGDAALSAALRTYDPKADLSQPTGHDTSPDPFEKLLEQSSPRQNLAWFFADWVNADKGLPDLSIDSAFPVPAEAGNYLVTVTVANAGYASAEVPITVRSATNSATQRLLVPARGKAAERVLVSGKPTEVQVNDGTVPETTATVHITHLTQPGQDNSTLDPASPTPDTPSPAPPQP